MSAPDTGPVFDWLDHFVALGRDGAMRDVGRLRRLAPQDEWLVGIKAVASDADVHGDVWERHPAGDEMLCVLEGRVVVTLMAEERHRAARRVAQAARGLSRQDPVRDAGAGQRTPSRGCAAIPQPLVEGNLK
jgi:hypothetical protein